MRDFIHDPEHLSTLHSLGLSQYEATVYLALLGEQAADAATIIRKSGVPQNKAYEALNSLERKGFAEQVLSDRKRFRAVEPATALARHRRATEQSLEQAARAMHALAKAAPTAPAAEPSLPGARLINPEQASSYFHERMLATDAEFLCSLRYPATVIGSIEDARQAREAGFKTRWLLERALLEDPEHGPQVRAWALAIGNARVADFVPLRMAIFDGRECMLELRETDGRRYALALPNPGLAEDMRALFMRLYAEATPVEQFAATPERRTP